MAVFRTTCGGEKKREPFNSLLRAVALVDRSQGDTLDLVEAEVFPVKHPTVAVDLVQTVPQLRMTKAGLLVRIPTRGTVEPYEFPRRICQDVLPDDSVDTHYFLFSLRFRRLISRLR